MPSINIETESGRYYSIDTSHLSGEVYRGVWAAMGYGHDNLAEITRVITRLYPATVPVDYPGRTGPLRERIRFDHAVRTAALAICDGAVPCIDCHGDTMVSDAMEFTDGFACEGCTCHECGDRLAYKASSGDTCDECLERLADDERD